MITEKVKGNDRIVRTLEIISEWKDSATKSFGSLFSKSFESFKKVWKIKAKE